MSDEAPIGHPTGAYEGLPGAWRIALRFCPWCGGVGSCEGMECSHCEASGDLLGSMLLDAYNRGVEHVVARTREIAVARAAAISQAVDEKPSRDQLKAAMGLR